MTDLVIDVHDLQKRFGGHKVVHGLNLQVALGEVCGFLGANGSGKTTTIRMLCGLLTPDGGRGSCLGLDIISDAPRIQRQVGYMTQRFSLYEDLTVFENLDFVARVYQMRNRRQVVQDIMGRMSLAGAREPAYWAPVRGLEAKAGARCLCAARAKALTARRAHRRRRCERPSRVLGPHS